MMYLIKSKLSIKPWWVTGIVDSEGNFSINYNINTKKCTFSFKVTQNGNSVAILFYLKEFFKVGNINIDNRKTNGYKFIVSNRKYLIDVIIPHFEKYPLEGSKHLDYLDFKNCILLMEESSNNIGKVLSIKKNMNRERSYEQRWSYLRDKNFHLKSEWVQAFIDGEGTFQCRIADTISRNSKYVSVNPTLEIAQKSHDVFVLKAIIEYFGIGYLKPKYDIFSLKDSLKSRDVSRAIFNQHEVIIKFVDKYPMLTCKQLDYLDWKEIIMLKNEGTHRTEEGKQRMLEFKLGMNRGRLLNSNLFNNSDKLLIMNSTYFENNTKVSEDNE